MLVYRVETSEGLGPFRTNLSSHVALTNRIQAYYTRFSHPTPWSDGMSGRDNYGNHKFACISVEQLVNWFAGEEERVKKASIYMKSKSISKAQVAAYNRILLKMFKRRNYQISVYRTPTRSVEFGRTQVAYDSRDAKLVKVIPIDELFKGVPI